MANRAPEGAKDRTNNAFHIFATIYDTAYVSNVSVLIIEFAANF